MSNVADPDSLAFDFIDPLFAIAIHISLTEGLMKTQFYECWVRAGSLTREVLRSANCFDLMVLILGYSIVITSWFGYHRSVAKSPIRLDTLPGIFRFILDVVLLLIYCLILARFEDFTFVLGGISLAFLLFVIWDQFKRVEHGGAKEEIQSARRRGVSVVWFIAFLVLFLLDLLSLSRWLLLSLGIVFSILYRLHKAWPWLVLERFFCFPLPHGTQPRESM